ncbi:MAG TPA: hypothetical protein VFI95_04505 [Terriglobales bacterium]|nr:hypothetical protein [Terriglobales bacterium]
MQSLAKRDVLRSLILAAASSVAAYLFVWGLAITHPELALPSAAALPTAIWLFPLCLVASLMIALMRHTPGRRH